MGKVAIVILNWNQSAYTIQCINSLLHIDYLDFSIFLIDNGSSREDLQNLESYVTECSLDIIFTKSDTNLGFTGGNNVLLQEVLVSDAFEYSLLLNNDTVVERDFLSKLVCKLEENHYYGSIGPLVLNAANRSIIDSAGTHTIVSLAQGTLIGHGKVIEEVNPIEKEVGYVTGCAVLIRNSVLKEVGLLDNDFFAYFEDIDLGVRITKAGYKNIFYPESVIYHYGSISTGEKSEFYYTLSCRNRLMFARKHQSSMNFYLVFIPYFILWKLLLKFITSKSKKNFVIGHFKGIEMYISKKRPF